MSGQAFSRARLVLPLLCAHAASSCGPTPPRAAAGSDATAAGSPAWESVGSQHATPEDMHVFDPYIGRFAAAPFAEDVSGDTIHFEVEYAWFDGARTIVKLTVARVRDRDGAATPLTEGFYGYDPFHERIYAVAAFTWGETGFGTVGEFDRTTHRRVTRARSRDANGVTTEVRDAFEIVGADAWRNVTSVRSGDETAWRVVTDEVFTRIR